MEGEWCARDMVSSTLITTLIHSTHTPIYTHTHSTHTLTQYDHVTPTLLHSYTYTYTHTLTHP